MSTFTLPYTHEPRRPCPRSALHAEGSEAMSTRPTPMAPKAASQAPVQHHGPVPHPSAPRSSPDTAHANPATPTPRHPTRHRALEHASSHVPARTAQGPSTFSDFFSLAMAIRYGGKTKRPAGFGQWRLLASASPFPLARPQGHAVHVPRGTPKGRAENDSGGHL